MVQNIIDDLIAAATGGGGSTSGSGASSQNVANHNATAQSLAQRVTNNRSNTLYNFGTISYAGGAMGSNPLDIFG